MQKVITQRSKGNAKGRQSDKRLTTVLINELLLCPNCTADFICESAIRKPQCTANPYQDNTSCERSATTNRLFIFVVADPLCHTPAPAVQLSVARVVMPQSSVIHLLLFPPSFARLYAP